MIDFARFLCITNKSWLETARCGWKKPSKRRTHFHAFRAHDAVAQSLEPRTVLTAGVLDPSFGVGGLAVTNLGFDAISNDAGSSVAYQSDGKAIVLGTSSGSSVVVRYQVDGSLDSSFGSNGVAKLTIGERTPSNHSLTVDANDRILVVGDINQGTGDYDVTVFRLTAGGTVDTTFGNNGLQLVDFNSTSDGGWGIAVDSLGRIVVGGNTSQVATGGDIAVARLTDNGQLDASFDGDGRQTVDFAGANDNAYGVALDSQDRVVLAGSTSFFSPATGLRRGYAVARLSSDGSLDHSFDGDGRQTVDFGDAQEIGYAVAVDSLDRVVVNGRVKVTTAGTDFGVVRLTESGVLDSSFDGDGIQIVDFSTTQDSGQSVATDASDRVVVGGYARPGSKYDFAVARLTASGSLDTSFDGDGRRTIDFAGLDDLGYDVAIDANQQILIGGSVGSPLTQTDIGVAKLADDGSLVTGFSGDGRQTTEIGKATFDLGRAVTTYADGRSLMVGLTGNGLVSVARFLEDGSLDPSFGTNGSVKVGFARSVFGYSIALDSQERIVVSGASNNDFAVFRLLSNGALDASFDGDGRQTIDFGASDSGYGVAVDNSDRVIVSGFVYRGSAVGYDFAVARLNSNGSLDTTFDGDGKQTIDFGSNRDVGYTVALDSQERIVVAGYTDQVATGFDFAVARLNSDGSLDSSFDGDGKQTVDFNNINDGGAIVGVAVDSQDRVVLGGGSGSDGATLRDVAVARLMSDGSLDNSFDEDGRQLVDFGNTSDFGNSVAVDSLDRVLVAGYSEQPGAQYDAVVARLTSDGLIDSFFGDAGRKIIDFGNTPDLNYSVTVDSKDRVLIGGYAERSATSADFAMARLIEIPQAVNIDVKPGSSENRVNVNSQGVIAVAIYSTSDFNVADIDLATVRLGGVAAVQSALEDVDNDGDLDLILHFRTQDLVAALNLILQPGTTQDVTVTLTGRTNDLQQLAGTDTIRFFRNGR